MLIRRRNFTEQLPYPSYKEQQAKKSKNNKELGGIAASGALAGTLIPGAKYIADKKVGYKKVDKGIANRISALRGEKAQELANLDKSVGLTNDELIKNYGGKGWFSSRKLKKNLQELAVNSNRVRNRIEASYNQKIRSAGSGAVRESLRQGVRKKAARGLAKNVVMGGLLTAGTLGYTKYKQNNKSHEREN